MHTIISGIRSSLESELLPLPKDYTSQRVSRRCRGIGGSKHLSSEVRPSQLCRVEVDDLEVDG